MKPDATADLGHTGNLAAINHAVDGLAGDPEKARYLVRTQQVRKGVIT